MHVRQDQHNQTSTSRRFVVLRHELPEDADIPSHWDLMIESDHGLRTWRLFRDWRGPEAQQIEQVADHRLEFLEREGPLGGNRGSIRRVDFGTLIVRRWTPQEIAGTIAGQDGAMALRLTRVDAADGHDRWTMEPKLLESNTTFGATMIKRQPWFERTFPSGLAGHLLPVIIERLRGTPARLHERLHGLSESTLVRKSGNTWSIQENAGHLLDVEPLWSARVAELAAGRAELVAADLQNRKTHEANHNQSRPADIESAFRVAREDFVRQLESFPIERIEFAAVHPRLKTGMNVTDLSYFVAEHDDYHLARISELLREFS